MHALALAIASALLTYGGVQIARQVIADLKRNPLADVNDNKSDQTIFAMAILVGVGFGMVLLPWPA